MRGEIFAERAKSHGLLDGWGGKIFWWETLLLGMLNFLVRTATQFIWFYGAVDSLRILPFGLHCICFFVLRSSSVSG